MATCDIDGANHIVRPTRPPLCVHTACDHGAGLQICLDFTMTETTFWHIFTQKTVNLKWHTVERKNFAVNRNNLNMNKNICGGD